MGSLPLIDISALATTNIAARRAVANAIGKAFHDIGFIAIQGHGIPELTVSRLRQQVINYFNRPLAEKMTLAVTPENYRGYIPLGFFTPNATDSRATGKKSGSRSADLYEAYKLHFEVTADDPICSKCRLYGPNKWPTGASALKRAVSDFWSQCDRVTYSLLDAVATLLEVDPAYFRSAFDKPLTNMTLLHYPAMHQDEGRFGIHPHKDTDVLTILAPDPVGGLFVRPRNSRQWLAADVPAGALVVNVGDMLEIWSGGYFVSTPHKVINPVNQERYSFPYFAVPRFDIRVKPLRDSMHVAGKAADRAQTISTEGQREMLVGEVSQKIWQSNWPDAEPVEQCYDPYVS